MAKPALKLVSQRPKRTPADEWNDYAGVNYRQLLKDPKFGMLGLWQRHLEEQGKSPRSIETYSDAVSSFRQFLGETKGPFDIAPEDIAAWLDGLRRQGRKGSTLTIYYLGVRSFFNYMEAEEGLAENPAKAVKCPKPGEQRPLKMVPDEVFAALVADCLSDLRRDRFKALRDAAIVHCFGDTPGRLREIQNLGVGDVDLQGMRLIVRAKGGGFRDMPFGEGTAKALHRYLLERGRHEFAHLPWLWLGRTGQFAAVYQMFKARVKAIGHSELHPHDMRKTFAVAQLKDGMSEAYVQRIAGWRSNLMLKHYVGASMGELAAEDYRRRGSPMDRRARAGKAK